MSTSPVTHCPISPPPKRRSTSPSMNRCCASMRLSQLVWRYPHSLAAQPAAPDDGAIYIVPEGKSSAPIGAAWAQWRARLLSRRRVGRADMPQEGWRCFVHDEHALYVRTAGSLGQSLAASDERLPHLHARRRRRGLDLSLRQRTHAEPARSHRSRSIASDVITITTADAGLIFDQTRMASVCYVAHLEYIKRRRTQAHGSWRALHQRSAASAGRRRDRQLERMVMTIQLGDPTDITPNRFIAFDISPMMQAVLGRVFPAVGRSVQDAGLRRCRTVHGRHH
jgi:hypothetical protein